MPLSTAQAPDPLAAPLLPATGDGIEVVSPDEARFLRGPRAYRVRGLARALSAEALKVTLRLSLGERLHVDTLDLYQARSRAAFVKAAALELGVSETLLLADLSALGKQGSESTFLIAHSAQGPQYKLRPLLYAMLVACICARTRTPAAQAFPDR